jgi:hypothetical protein
MLVSEAILIKTWEKGSVCENSILAVSNIHPYSREEIFFSFLVTDTRITKHIEMLCFLF